MSAPEITLTLLQGRLSYDTAETMYACLTLRGSHRALIVEITSHRDSSLSAYDAMYYDLRLSPDQLPVLYDWVILNGIREYRKVLAEFGTATSGKEKESLEANLRLLEEEANRRGLEIEI